MDDSSFFRKIGYQSHLVRSLQIVKERLRSTTRGLMGDEVVGLLEALARLFNSPCQVELSCSLGFHPDFLLPNDFGVVVDGDTCIHSILEPPLPSNPGW